MFKNYLKIAWRNLVQKKKYTIINILGLALGVAFCILLFLYVQSEWSYDEFHQKAQRIYRVNRIVSEPGGEIHRAARTPAPMAAALKNTFPEIQQVVRLASQDVRIATSKKSFIKKNALLADASFFNVFTFPLLKGNPKTALAEPGSIVLTNSVVKKYFDDLNPVGRTVSVKIEDEELKFQVTGVAADPPANSSIQFDVLLPFKTIKYSYSGKILRRMVFQSWELPSGGTFVLLNHKANSEALNAKLASFADEHFKQKPEKTNLNLQPLTSIHHQTGISSAVLSPPANSVYAYLLAGLAFLVLLIACINFTTLSLGLSKSRSNEVGVRKAIGADRRQIRRQFWIEAVIITAGAVAAGLILARLFLPTFNHLVDTHLTLHLSIEVIGFLLALIIGVSLLAGSYPGLILSTYKPARIFSKRKSIGSSFKSLSIRRSLVVVQFALSIALIIGTLVMSAQLEFMQTNLGFNQQQVITITSLNSTSEGQEIFEPFKQEVLRNPSVESVAGTSFGFFGSSLETTIALGDTAKLQSKVLAVSDNFIETLEIALTRGRSFSSQRSTEGIPVMVNEALAQSMGWTSPVGKNITLSKRSLLAQVAQANKLHIIGVLENFHSQPLNYEIAPTIMVPSKTFHGVMKIYIRIKPEDIAGTLAFLREAWQEVAPNRLFEYQFMDEVVKEAYQTEQRWQTIINYAAGFALLITCFGIFGLSMLATERRTKEIGIRKVMGATVGNIVGLLSKDFIKLVLIGFVIAVPVAWYFMNQWLQDFAYRIDIGVGIFLLAGGLALLIALATVSWQSVRAALANPVDSLRSE